MVKLTLLFLLSLPLLAETPYFIRPVSANMLRGLPGSLPSGSIPSTARDTFQVFVQPAKPDTKSVVVQLFTRRNGVDRVLTGAASIPYGSMWMIAIEVDEIFTNLELVDIKITESPVALETEAASVPLKVLR